LTLPDAPSRFPTGIRQVIARPPIPGLKLAFIVLNVVLVIVSRAED